MLLQPLQDLLAGIYDLSMHYRVDDFLVTERAHLPAQVRDTATDEQVVVVEAAETGDPASVGLFLDPQLLARLAAANPIQALHSGNVADYWTALEGVSHFICLAWNADHDRAVSLLELETQAEVDKYAVTVFLLAEQLGGGSYPEQVHARLFDRVSFDVRLEPDQYERYRTAHALAARYCRQLERRFVNRGVARIEAMVRELRSFYRLRHAAKLRHALA